MSATGTKLTIVQALQPRFNPVSPDQRSNNGFLIANPSRR
jgi:hypothetical protein